MLREAQGEGENEAAPTSQPRPKKRRERVLPLVPYGTSVRIDRNGEADPLLCYSLDDLKRIAAFVKAEHGSDR
jgi:hypothetical protein